MVRSTAWRRACIWLIILHRGWPKASLVKNPMFGVTRVPSCQACRWFAVPQSHPPGSPGLQTDKPPGKAPSKDCQSAIHKDALKVWSCAGCVITDRVCNRRRLQAQGFQLGQVWTGKGHGQASVKLFHSGAARAPSPQPPRKPMEPLKGIRMSTEYHLIIPAIRRARDRTAQGQMPWGWHAELNEHYSHGVVTASSRPIGHKAHDREAAGLLMLVLLGRLLRPSLVGRLSARRLNWGTICPSNFLLHQLLGPHAHYPVWAADNVTLQKGPW